MSASSSTRRRSGGSDCTYSWRLAARQIPKQSTAKKATGIATKKKTPLPIPDDGFATAYLKHASVAAACASHAPSRTHRAICRIGGGPLNAGIAAAAGARTNRMKNHLRRSLGSIAGQADDRVTAGAVKV